MSTTMRRAAGLALLLVAAGGARAEDAAPTVEQLVARNLEARGGAARWKEVRTLELRGKFDAWSAPVDMTIARMRPQAYRFDYALFGAPATLASDGTTPWIAAAALGVPEAQPLDEAWKRNIVEDTGFISRLQQLAAAGAPMELVGRAQVDGTPAWKLRLAPADAPAEVWYLDAATGLELKRESTTFDVFSGAIEMPMETYYMDFREVEGLEFPFREERHFGTRYHLFVVGAVRVNPPVDPSRFAAPAPKKKEEPGAQS